PVIVSTPVTAVRVDTPLLDDDFNHENAGQGRFNYTNFAKWEVTRGAVDIVTDGTPLALWTMVPGINGYAIDLVGTGNPLAGRLESRSAFTLAPGTYQLSFDLAGSHRSFSQTDSVTVSLGDAYRETFALSLFDKLTVTRAVTVTVPTTGKLIF